MKAIVQLIGAVVAAVVPLLATDQPLSLVGWINVGVVAAGAVNVYITSNDLSGGVWSVSKLWVSLVSTIGVLAISLLADGSLSAADWMQIGAAVLAAIAVWWVPNPSNTPVPQP